MIGAFPIPHRLRDRGGRRGALRHAARGDAYAGFSNPTIVLIIVAFLVARSVVKCGLGERLGHRAISLFGRSTLGLSYSIFAVDAVISPAFPSNTARSGVLFPLAYSIADAAGVKPDREDRRRLGQYLMFSGMASSTLSSTLWLTAMAGNPLGAEIAKTYGVEIDFGSWFIASSVPTLLAMVLVPLLLYKIIRPEVTAMPEAPAQARKALAALGATTRDQKIVAWTFAGMVALGAPLRRWASTPLRWPSWASGSCSPPECSPSATSPRRVTSSPRSSGSPRCSP